LVGFPEEEELSVRSVLPFLSTHMLWELKGNTWEQDRDEG